jgi:hypothetical protein
MKININEFLSSKLKCITFNVYYSIFDNNIEILSIDVYYLHIEG